MQATAVGEVACHGATDGRLATVEALPRNVLPLRLGGQSRRGPCRIGLGLIEAHMRHGQVRRHGALAAQAILAPAIFRATPIHRRLDALRLHPGPAFRQPQRRLCIAAVLNELQILGVRHGPVRQRKRLQPDAMLRTFVVEAERTTGVHPLTRQPATVATKPKRQCGTLILRQGPPLARWAIASLPGGIGGRAGLLRPIRRLQRIAAKRHLEIRNQ